MADDLYAVWEGKRPRPPGFALRVVRKDGQAFHVIREDQLSDTAKGASDLVPLTDAVRDALRRADLDLA